MMDRCLAVQLLLVLPLVVVNAQLSVGPVILSGNDSCPPQDQLVSARQQLTERAFAGLATIYPNIPECGDGIWYKTISINMSDPLSQCPDGWVEENEGGVRTCGRGTVGGGCLSAFIPSSIREYSKVCGRAIGYQYGNTDAFAGRRNRRINDIYVDGLSITYGTPRQHLWTYAAAVREGTLTSSFPRSNCPCSDNPGDSAQAFVGNNWYCESGNPNPFPRVQLYSGDPLWDGENCEGSCCSNGKSPPWFTVELSSATNASIEARICASEHSDNNEDVFIGLFEIYVQ